MTRARKPSTGAPPAPMAQAPSGDGRVDYDRLLDALMRARSAFGPETELRRIENLPALTLLHSVMRLDAAVRALRAQARPAQAAATLTRRDRSTRDDD